MATRHYIEPGGKSTGVLIPIDIPEQHHLMWTITVYDSMTSLDCRFELDGIPGRYECLLSRYLRSVFYSGLVGRELVLGLRPTRTTFCFSRMGRSAIVLFFVCMAFRVLLYQKPT